MIIAGSITIALFFALLCHYVASMKNRNCPTWSILGAMFGPFALVAILLMGKSTTTSTA